MSTRRLFAGAFVALVVLALAAPHRGSAQQADTVPTPGVSQTQQPSGNSTPTQPATGNTARSSANSIPQAASQRADAWKLDLDGIALALRREGVTDEELAAQRALADEIAASARTLEGQLQPEIAAIQARLNQLGPAPKEGEPAESAEITARRTAESTALAEADTALKKVRLAAVQAEQAVRDIATLRRDRFARSLSTHNRSILSPALWMEGFQNLPKVTRGFSLLIGDSWSVAKSRVTGQSVALLIAAVFVAILIGVVVRRLARRLFPPLGDESDVPRLHKLLRAVLVTVTDGLLPVLAVAVVYLALDIGNLLTPRLVDLNRGLIAAVAVFSFLFGLSRGICAPLRRDWRLFEMSDTAAAQTVASVTLIGAVVAVGIYLETANDVLVSPLSVEVAKRAAMSLFIALILASGLWRLSAAWRSAQAGKPQPGVLWAWMRGILWLAIAAILVALVAGYIALANFVAIQLVFAGAIIAVVWLLLGLIEEMINSAITPQGRATAALSSTLGISESSVMQLSLVSSGILRLAVVIIGAVMVLLPWGFDTGQWQNWVQKAFFGFRIGEVSISLSSILSALVLFAIGVLATRAIQGWLANRFLPNTHFDLGLRNSIRTIIGYIGVVLAAIFAVTYLGLNLENVAILAGALSVGIGFGLQSIVNNFVSGLILLAERPIKEGDWIVVGTEQGNVRKISIRSTEIETFDRATVIVPNSDLITGTVKNWMHSSMMGRIVVPIGVSHGADPERVREIMLDIARAHPGVLAYPEPRVFFTEVAESSLNFNLYAYIDNVNNTMSVASDFRFEMLKRFREADIEIPYPQRDLNIRDIGRLESAIAGRSTTSGIPAQ